MIKGNDVANVLSGMLSSIQNNNILSADSLDNETIKSALLALEKKNPDEFYFNLIYPVGNIVDGLIRKSFNNENLIFLFKHHDFIDNHLSNLFEKIEGRGCSADKAGAVIRKLVNFYLTEEKIVWNYDQEYTYHLPKTVLKNHEQIIAYFDALNSLYYGTYDKYLQFLLAMSMALEKN